MERNIKYFTYGNEEKGEDYKIYEGTGIFLAFGVDFVEFINIEENYEKSN